MAETYCLAVSLIWHQYRTDHCSETRSMPIPLPVKLPKQVRLSADVDRAVAARVDAIAARYRVSRAETLRAMVLQALASQET